MKTKKKKRVYKKSFRFEKESRFFFVGIASILFFALGLTSLAIFQQNIQDSGNYTANKKVLSDSIITTTTTTTTIFYCIGGSGDGLCSIPTATVTPPIGISPIATQVVTPSGVIPITPTTILSTTVVPTSLLTVAPTASITATIAPTAEIIKITPVITADTTATPNPTPINDCSPLKDIVTQLLSLFINILNFLFGTSFPVPTVQSCIVATVVPTNVAPSTEVAPLTPIPGVSVYPDPVHSPSWAGYAYQLTPNATSATLRSNWNVSKMDCPIDGNLIMAPWIGFGGLDPTDPSIAQLGIGNGCLKGDSAGKTQYVAWTEAFPDPPVYYDPAVIPVAPGDQISQKITFQGDGKFSTQMTNKTQGWSLSLPMAFDKMTAPHITGEAVIEFIGLDKGNEVTSNNSNILSASTKLLDWTPPTNFTDIYYSTNREAEQSLVTAGLLRIELWPKDGVQLTETSPLTGVGFTIKKK